MKKNTAIGDVSLALIVTIVFLICKSFNKGDESSKRFSTGWLIGSDASGKTGERLGASQTPSGDERESEINSGAGSLPENPEALVAWLYACDSGIRINQAVNDDGRYSAILQYGEGRFRYDEDPPWYEHQLKTQALALVLGKRPERHRTTYMIDSLVLGNTGGARELPGSIRISFPNTNASSGGFVFVRNDIPITKIGIIIPDVSIPPGMPVDAWEWRFEIRHYEGGGLKTEYFREDQNADAVVETLDESKVVLMRTGTPPYPEKAKVLWFAIANDGTMTLIPKDTPK